MKIPLKEATEIVYENHEDYKMIEEKIVDQRRWVTTWFGVFKNKVTGKHYQVCYDRGSTESQDSEPFYGEEIEFEEVELKEVLVKQWVVV